MTEKLETKAEELALDIVKDITKRAKKDGFDYKTIPSLLRKRADWIEEILDSEFGKEKTEV